ncbi:MAG: type II secretion system F family protein, partial [Planctomycetota bacterium]
MARRIQRTSPAPRRSAASGGNQGGGGGAAPASSGRGKRVDADLVTDFTVQLATLSDAGIPVVKALTILEGQTPQGPFKAVLREITEDVSGGSPLSE